MLNLERWWIFKKPQQRDFFMQSKFFTSFIEAISLLITILVTCSGPANTFVALSMRTSAQRWSTN